MQRQLLFDIKARGLSSNPQHLQNSFVAMHACNSNIDGLRGSLTRQPSRNRGFEFTEEEEERERKED